MAYDLIKLDRRKLLPALVFLSLCLASCAEEEKENVTWIKTHFPEAEFKHTNPDLTYNITGGHSGFGDITGPLWVLNEMHHMKPQLIFTAIIDDYSYGVLQKMYGFKNLSELNDRFGIEFITPAQAKQIHNTGGIFELFSGARGKSGQKNHPFYGSKNFRLFSDPMHGVTKDYIEDRHGIRIFFNPPGIGPYRSGIVENPDTALFVGKSKEERRHEALKYFPPGLLHDIIQGERFHGANLSFLYGCVTTKGDPILKPQTATFIHEVKRINSPHHPLLVLSPAPKDLLVDLTAGHGIPVYTIQEFEKIHHLMNHPYLISLGSVSSLQFTSLIAVADTPVIVEGNSSISTAIRLEHSFLMFRSPWNNSQIQDVILLEKLLGSHLYQTVYGKGTEHAPEFSHYLANQEHADQREAFTHELNHRLPSFGARLWNILDVYHQVKDLDHIRDLHKREEGYLDLTHEVRHKTGDIYLEYSIILNAFLRGAISESAMDLVDQNLIKEGIDPSKLKPEFKLKPEIN